MEADGQLHALGTRWIQDWKHVTTRSWHKPFDLIYKILSCRIIRFSRYFSPSLLWLLGDHDLLYSAETVYVHLCFVT